MAKPKSAKPASIKPNAKLEQNLGYSMQAVNYVLHRAKIKAANYDEYDPVLKPITFEYHAKRASFYDRVGDKQSADAHDRLAQTLMSPTDKCVYIESRPHAGALISLLEWATDVTVLQTYRIIANGAKYYGCGNCQEASISAFMYLYDMGVRPIDRFRANPDHDFVVIGRQQHENFADWSSWGDHAVICDPWSQGLQKGRTGAGTYSASQFGNVMGSILPNIEIFETYREE